VRIGFDAKRLFNNFTGLGNYSRFVADALAAYYPEHEYLLYTPRIKNHPETKAYLHTNRFVIRQPESGLAKRLPAWWRSYALGNVAAADGVQIFHGLSNELPLTKPAALKTVLTVHDLIFKRFPGYYNPIDVRIYGWKLKHACQSADLVVAVSQQTAADLREFMGVPADKLRVIYQGCHPAFKRVATDEEKKRVKAAYQLPDEYVLFVGTLEERKNAVQLVKAASLLKTKAPVVLVGRATPYMKKIDQAIKQFGMEGQVRVLHGVSFNDLPAVYQQASVFVYPSVFEGFGIPIVEAIVSGVPVITSHGSCFDEAGGPATRYVNPTRADELATQIDELLGSAELRKEIVAKSQAYVKHFEPSVIAERLMQQYTQLI